MPHAEGGPADLCQEPEDIFHSNAIYIRALIDEYNLANDLKGSAAITFDDVDRLWRGEGDHLSSTKLMSMIGENTARPGYIERVLRFAEEEWLDPTLNGTDEAEPDRVKIERLRRLFRRTASEFKHKAVALYESQMLELDRAVLAMPACKARIASISDTLQILEGLDDETIPVSKQRGRFSVIENIPFTQLKTKILEAKANPVVLQPDQFFALLHSLIQFLTAQGKPFEAGIVAQDYKAISSRLELFREAEYESMRKEGVPKNFVLENPYLSGNPYRDRIDQILSR